MRKELVDFVLKYPIPNPLHATLTEKQGSHGFAIDDIRSERNFRHFQNLLNRRVFGNAHRRYGKKLKTIVVREVGGGGRHHLHCIIEMPDRLAPDSFCELVRECWWNTDFGYHQTHLQVPTEASERTGYLKYIMKNRTKPRGLLDSIDWVNSTTFETL